MLFGYLLERRERRAPQAIEVRAHAFNAVGVKLVEVARALFSLAHEPTLLQDLQVLRDGRPTHWQVPCEFPDRERAACEARHDRPSGGVPEGIALGISVSHDLR